MATSTQRMGLPPWLWALVLALGLALPYGLAQAEEEQEPPAEEEGAEGDEEESPLEAATPEQVKTLTAQLKKVAKKKNANDVLPTLEEIEFLSDPAFDKPLLKFLKHPSSLVAMKAAEMWEWRAGDKKVRKKLWKASFGEKKNKRRFGVKALVLVAFARAGHTLDDKQYRAVASDWRWILGNPNPRLAPALVSICRYFELSKDKRHCRKLAEELDDPCANVNAADPAAMPMDWQERRWKLWNQSKPAVIAALKALTGQEFEKEETAKAWFKENEKSFGFKW